MSPVTIVIAVVGLVVIALLAYFFLFRGKDNALVPTEEREGLKESKADEKKPKEKAERAAEPAERKPEAKPAKVEASPPQPRVEKKEKKPEVAVDVVVEDAAGKQPSAPSVKAAKKDVAGLRKGLAATRGGLIARLTALFTGKKEIDPAILEQMEEVMLSSDVGVKTTHSLLERLREQLQKSELKDADAVWAALRAQATKILSIGGGGIRMAKKKPTVVLMVGVNGVGKTTSIGKLATRFKNEGKTVLLAAGDTFRAAAVQQLEVWGKRVGAEVVKGKEGSDPGAVAFDATTKSKDNADILLIDTAGRLHTKAPLMDEIKKVKKSVTKALEDAPHETLLVLDATTGQNALTQAAMFKDAVELTGIILTKLDGTAKGGIVLGICDELKLPVRYIGIGERAEDLREFQAEEFVEALFGGPDDEAAAA